MLGLTTIAVLIFDEISRVRIYGPPPSQNAQFHSLEAALELFKNHFQEYPPSDANDPKLFYKITKSDKSTKVSRPVRADSFILISAGMDGLYGTEDDICNFDFKFPKQ